MNDNNEMFDPDQFVQDQQDGGFATKFELLAKGDYDGLILSKIGKAVVIESQETPPKYAPFGKIDLFFEVPIPQDQQEVLGDKPREVRMELSLDLDPKTKKLDRRPGKNVRLGRLLAANGLNDKPWSFTMLVNTGPYKGKLDWKADNRDSDLPVDERRQYERIVSVTQ